jgi:hypothetical protein
MYTALFDSVFAGIDKNPKKFLPFSLDQNYPNPGKEETWISFMVHYQTKVTLKVFDIFGREITTLINDKSIQPGKYIERFDISRVRPAPGIYYFSLTSGEQSLKRKMIIQ